MTEINRTPVKEKAKQLIKLLRQENPDYNYLREVFRQIRKELDVQVNTGTTKKLPQVPTEEEIAKYYDVVWKARNMQHVVMIKTLLYCARSQTEVFLN